MTSLLARILFILLLAFSATPLAYAEDMGGSAAGSTFVDPLGLKCNNGGATNNCLAVFVHNILEIVVRIGAIVLVLMLVYVGFLFVVARGAPEEISKAKNALLWTVIGGLVLLGAQALANGIQATVTALSGS